VKWQRLLQKDLKSKKQLPLYIVKKQSWKTAWRQAVQAEEVTVLSDAIEAKQAKVLVQKFELKSHKSLQINERFLLACEQ
jgi:hypothetical protein